MEGNQQPSNVALRNKVERLIAQYEDVKQRNAQLSDELASLNEQLQEAHKQIVDLQNAYNSLKMARMMGVSEADKQLAFRRLTNMIKQIDTCINLLN